MVPLAGRPSNSGAEGGEFKYRAYGVFARTGGCPTGDWRGMLGDRCEVHMTKTILAGLALLAPVACRAADELKPFDASRGCGRRP